MSLRRGPPAKRARLNSESTSPTPHHPNLPFLSKFAERTAIAIILAPLRKRQGEILSRNLSEAGAFVLPFDQTRSDRSDRRSPRPELLVVTDNALRAQNQLSSFSAVFEAVHYVSTKWSSKVLLSRTFIPVSPYLLFPTEACDLPANPISKSKPPPSSTFLPVWCSRHQYLNNPQYLFSLLPPHLCQRPTITQTIYPSPNHQLSQILQTLAQKRILEQAGGNPTTADIRARAYTLAAAALNCVPFPLTSPRDASALRSFGPRIVAIVTEYLTTRQVTEALQVQTEPRLSALSRFTKLYGVGPKTARYFYDTLNITTIPQLLDQLNARPQHIPQKLARYLAHYDVLSQIDLTTATAFAQEVCKLANGPPVSLGLRLVLCGGFRRGEFSGHDVDLLYCRKSPHLSETTSIMSSLVSRLQAAGLLCSVLSLSTNLDGHQEKRYHKELVNTSYPFAHDVLHGLATFNQRTFRVDIVGVRRASEFPFATLAWSGSTPFQRDLRQWCEKRGWIFNQHGLFDRITGHPIKLSPNPRSEHDIFAALDLIYRPPFERSC